MRPTNLQSNNVDLFKILSELKDKIEVVLPILKGLKENRNSRQPQATTRKYQNISNMIFTKNLTLTGFQCVQKVGSNYIGFL